MNDLDRARESLGRNGFVVRSDVFTPTEVEAAARILDSCFQPSRRPRAKALKGASVQEVCRCVRARPELRRTAVFRNCLALADEILGSRAKYTFDHAIYKRPGADSEIGWHQDQAYQRWNLAMRGLHFWIPLQEMNEHMGGMEFVLGSHRLECLEHLPVTGSKTFAAREDERWVVEGASTPLGGVSIHLPLTVHRSTANTSDRVRRAWILHFGPSGGFDALRRENLARHWRKWQDLGRTRNRI